MGFEVGDNVRILGGTKQEGWASGGSMKKTIGMVGKITDIDRHDPKYRVTLEDGDLWDYNEEDLEKVENMKDLRKLLKQGYIVEHMDEMLSKVEKNANEELVISSKHRWFPVENLTEQLDYTCYFENDKDHADKVKIKAIYGLSDENMNAYKISKDGREKIWELIEKSPIQIKLEELESEQRKIADKIAELRKEQYGI